MLLERVASVMDQDTRFKKTIRNSDEPAASQDTPLSEKELDELPLEELFTRLDAIISRLEDPSTPLEEAFAGYKRGLEVLQTCTRKVDLTEKELILLEGSGESE